MTNYEGGYLTYIEYKDGKNDGLITDWYENGWKMKKYTYKDGNYDGLGTIWYSNGQKSYEGTYKDGV